MSSDADYTETSKPESQVSNMGSLEGRSDQLEAVITQQHQMIGQLTTIVEKLTEASVRTEAPDEQ
jgi:hypothetical protein